MLEPWQVPVVVMALIAGPVSIHGLIKWFYSKTGAVSSLPNLLPNLSPARQEWLKTIIFATLSVTALVIFLVIAGTETASLIATVASAVSALVASVLTVQSLLTVQEIKKNAGNADGQ